MNSATPTSPRVNYPIRCIECGRKEVRPAIVRHQIDRNHDGRTYALDVPDLPVTRCDACGEIYFTAESGQCFDAALQQMRSSTAPPSE